MQRAMAAQRLLHQVGRQIAATAALLQGMALQFVHDTARQSDVDALGAGRISHGSTAGRRSLPFKPLLQLLNQILKKWHDKFTRQ